METTLTRTQGAAIATADTANQLAAITNHFIAELDVRPKSREIYTRNIGAFFRWVQSTGRQLNALTAADVVAYKTHLTENYSPATAAGYIAAVRRFYVWAEANQLAPNIAAAVKPPKRAKAIAKQPLTIEDTGRLLQYEAENDRRNYAIINLMLRAGLRCIEVSRANVGDITTIAGRRVLYVQGKGKDAKDNFVILTPDTYKPIAQYLETRQSAATDEPLFISRSHNNQNGRLTTRAISGIAKNGLQNIGLNERFFTAHSLRHTAAVNILRAGGTLLDAKRTLRHANIETTQIYTATMEQEQRLKNGGELIADEFLNKMIGKIEATANY